MPADIVNLNKFKKAKAREQEEKRAEENRAKFGRTKEERCKEVDEAARRNTLLDGARREGGIENEREGGKPSEGDGTPTADKDTSGEDTT